MKKFIIFFTVLLVFSLPAMAGSFPDVPSDHQNYNAIEFLDANEIVGGYDDGSFKPDNFVNRAEAAKIIIGTFNIATDGNYEVLFPDVPNTQWYFKYVMGGREAGILSGHTNGTFKPTDTVNLAETLKMMLLAAKIEIPAEILTDIFNDVPKTQWYAKHAMYAREKNIVLTDKDGNLNANQPMTRAKFAEVIYRMKTVADSGGAAFPLHKDWTLYEGSKIPFKMKYDPVNWDITENADSVSFLMKNKDLAQGTPVRVYPDSALVWVYLDKNLNNYSKDTYFEKVKGAFPSGAEFNTFQLKGIPALEVVNPNERIVDWYLYLNDKSVLIAYTQYGVGGLTYNSKQYIKAMLSTFEYQPASEAGKSKEEVQQLISGILSNVLIEGQGMNMLNKLGDKVIIETDTIGVGTGPVDYYYSKEIDYTLKYERSGDVILDKRPAKTSSF